MRIAIKRLSSLKRNESKEGEKLEQKIERILDRNEPITDGAPIIHQRRDEGIRPEFDIRTNKWDLAAKVTTAGAKGEAVKRVQMYGGSKNEDKGTAGTDSQSSTD